MHVSIVPDTNDTAFVIVEQGTWQFPDVVLHEYPVWQLHLSVVPDTIVVALVIWEQFTLQV